MNIITFISYKSKKKKILARNYFINQNVIRLHWNYSTNTETKEKIYNSQTKAQVIFQVLLTSNIYSELWELNSK